MTITLTRIPLATATMSSIERLSFFQGALHISGYLFDCERRVVRLSVQLSDGRTIAIQNWGLPSPHLSMIHGRVAATAAFDEVLSLGGNLVPALSSHLRADFSDGTVFELPLALSDPSDLTGQLMERFFEEIKSRPPGHIIEIGSRARTGAVYTSLLPPGWRYTGMDIMEGPNVDIVGDAHRASALLPNRHYDAMMSFAVFEHLLMPWKAAIEVNKLLRIGGIGIILAPQTWPLHEEPCDYFRFSRHSWKALFNSVTGFQILATAHGGKAYIVPHHLSAASAFGEWHTAALMSGVLFRKISDTSIDWPVEMTDIASDTYPA
jgi:hypothetical protein